MKQILKESARLVVSGAKSVCRFSLADNLWSVEIDTGQIHQAVSNVLINAIQAMPRGGVIQIDAENKTIGRKDIIPLPPGPFIHIRIQDSGTGIPQAHLTRIFDPFFTTKHKGNGLGLATTFSIIKRHSGHISVESETGKGTVFHIYLPASGKPVIQTEEKPRLKYQGSGRILVMDDQDAVLEVAERMLEVMGYETACAVNGSIAIEMYREAAASGRPFDAVILDLTVPGGMGGAETLPALLKIDPQVKAIVSSGYSNDPIMSDYRAHGFSGVVPKPYTIDQLYGVLDGILNQDSRQ